MTAPRTFRERLIAADLRRSRRDRGAETVSYIPGAKTIDRDLGEIFRHYAAAVATPRGLVSVEVWRVGQWVTVPSINPGGAGRELWVSRGDCNWSFSMVCLDGDAEAILCSSRVPGLRGEPTQTRIARYALRFARFADEEVSR